MSEADNNGGEIFKGKPVISDQQPQRIEFLDSIRGLAALAVLSSHVLLSFHWQPAIVSFLYLPLVHTAFDGKAAVAMFFVLSGFVLSRPYFVSSSQPRSRRKMVVPIFYVRRFTRIWLPWFFAFCLSVVAQIYWFKAWPTVPLSTEWFTQHWHVPLTLDHFLKQCAFRMGNNNVNLLTQDWSLGIELKASLMLPFLIYLSNRWSAYGLSAAFCLIMVFSKGHFYASFIFGVLLARHGSELVSCLSKKPRCFRVWLILIGLGLSNVYYYTAETHPLSLPWQKLFWLATSIGCVFILMASMASKSLQAKLNMRIATFLGRISYSIYLLQMIVILCFQPMWMHFLNYLGVLSTALLLPLTLIFSVGMTILLAALGYRLVEEPCIELGHKISKLLEKKPTK